VLGSQFLGDIAEFFILFQTMYDGFVDRAHAVTRLLADRRTTFVVVTTLDPAPVREAEFFIDALADRGFDLGAVVLNKVLPAFLLDRAAAAAARVVASEADAVAARVAESGRGRLADADMVARVLREMGESFLNYRVIANREAEQRAELSRKPRAGGQRALLRHRHPRPGRPVAPGRTDLALTGGRVRPGRARAPGLRE